MVLKNHELLHVKHRKCIFVPHDVYSLMYTIKLKFDDAERLSGRSDANRTQKVSYYLHILEMRGKNKVALAVELSIIKATCIRTSTRAKTAFFTVSVTT